MHYFHVPFELYFKKNDSENTAVMGKTVASIMHLRIVEHFHAKSWIYEDSPC
jgi:hypothetical protein